MTERAGSARQPDGGCLRGDVGHSSDEGSEQGGNGAVAELPEPRPVTDGNPRGQSTGRTPSRGTVTQAAERIRRPEWAAVAPEGRSRMR